MIPLRSRRAWVPFLVLAATLAASLTAACRTRPSEIAWTRSLADATSRAAAREQLVVVDLFTDWCGWCKEMDRTTWVDPSVVAEGARFVFLKLNAETDPDGIAIQKRFRVAGYPMVLLLDSLGEEFERLQGYLPAPRFLERLRTLVAAPDSLGNLKARERRDPANLGVKLEIGRKLLDRDAFADARTRFERVLADDPDDRKGLGDQALFYLAACKAHERRSAEAIADLRRLQQRHRGSSLAPRASLLEGELLLRSGRKDAARARLGEFLKRWPDHELAAEARALLEET